MSKDFSSEFAIFCEYPNTPNVKKSSLDVRLKSPNLVPLTINDLTLALKLAFDPLGLTLALVEKLL